ncbi:M14-type cytosolic carboxypeptidase [Altererythrobacter sp. GH1-8]|uniref:M14 family metallopeptidase n=1 Tax=Altererythrobacter sp. GH1-8 TaxID=3349333 RepID=UPI00374CC05F
MRTVFLAGAFALAVSSCAPSAQIEPTPPASALPDNARCAGGGVAIDTDFPAGSLANCSIDQAGNVAIILTPEDTPPINCSPWYAFRVHTAQPRDVKVKLTYTACGHRYWPKISVDAKQWENLPQAFVEVSEIAGRDQAEITVTTGTRPLFVSAQEIIAPATYDAWLDGLEDHPELERSLLGKSAQGREIEVIRFGNKSAREQVLLVGRQHPPEVSGALAMFPFVEELLSESDLAKRFRARFQVIAVPLLNPDGVVLGYWRHNTGGVDLNRDWGPFTQPETQLMKGVLDTIAANPDQSLRLLLDFHSTQRDIFYTIPDELPTDPELFTAKWLDRYQEMMPDYEVERDARHEVGRPISKAYAYDTFGVPAITFELGDETDRGLIKRIGKQSAIAMMETLLATPER